MDENDIKKFCIIMACDHLQIDNKKKPLAEAILKEAKKLFAWFKKGEGNQ